MNVQSRRKFLLVAVNFLIILHITGILIGCLILGYSISLVFPLIEVQENARSFLLSALLLITVSIQFCAAEVDALRYSGNMRLKFWIGIGWSCFLTLMVIGFIYLSDIGDGGEHMLSMCRLLILTSPALCFLKYVFGRNGEFSSGV
jgi:hypothetical protein